MKLEILKECGWKKIYINILDFNHQLIRSELLVFCNKKAFINLNLSNEKYYFLSNEKGYETEIIIVSEIQEKISIKYNRKLKKYYINLVDDFNLYSCVNSVVLKDYENLWFRPNKAKKLDIIIPKNYDTNKKYPLLIMFDGQNLFDKNNTSNYTSKNDPYGSWQIDISLSNLSKKTGMEFIVVGIEHTDILRTNELLTNTSLFPLKDNDLLDENERIGYIDYLDNFINKTILPYMTTNYSIDINNIGIGGSSMGGMGCHYIGLKNLGKYKFILSFTPASALVTDSSWVEFYNKLNFKSNIDKLPIFYFFQGNNGELENMLYEGNKELVNNLIKSNYPQSLIKSYIEQSAEHNEIAWRYAFNYMIYDIFK